MPEIKTEVVSSLCMRTKQIFDRGESFIVLPGESDTLAELSMLIAMKGASILNKPIYIINLDNWFDSYLSIIKGH
jgi:predicted Rossmann-fold nucleotide-binding protein